MHLIRAIFFLSLMTAFFKAEAEPKPVPNGGICLSKYSKDSLPRGFRSLYKLKGFPDNFRISGSAQMTEKQIENLVYFLRKLTGEADMPIYVVDLRHELHGFYQDLPIYVWDENYWEHMERLVSEGYERSYFDNLNTLDEVPYYPVIEKIKGKRYFEVESRMYPKKYPVSREEDVCDRLGIKYFRIPILDRDRPDHFTVNAILKFFKSVPKNAWIHVHCHGGKGRTSTFLLMYHLYRKKEDNLEAVVKRHAETGSVDLLNKVADVKPHANESRKQFIRDFFSFSQARPLGSWKESCPDSLCRQQATDDEE